MFDLARHKVPSARLDSGQAGLESTLVHTMVAERFSDLNNLSEANGFGYG